VVDVCLGFLAQVAEQRCAERIEPSGLRIDARVASLDRELSPPARVDVDVQAVARGLGIGDDLDPDTWGDALLVDEAVRAATPPGLRHPISRRHSSHVANPVGGGSSTYSSASAQNRASRAGCPT